jgi:hypothetical protein
MKLEKWKNGFDVTASELGMRHFDSQLVYFFIPHPIQVMQK